MRWLFIVCLLFAFLTSNGQVQERILQLKAQLAEADERAQFNILNDLAWEYRTSYADSGIYFAERAYALGKKWRIKELAKSLNFMGISNSYKGDNMAAYEHYQQALAVAEENKDYIQLGHANNNMGRLLMEQGLLEKARPFLLDARDLFNAQRDSSGLAYSFQSLGAFHLLTFDTIRAEADYQQAYRIRVAQGATREVIAALLQLGKFYLSTRRIDQGLRCFTRADSAGQLLNDGILRAEIKIEMAECLFLKGDLEPAEKMASEGLQQITSSQNVRLLPEAYLTMGQILHQKGQLDRAREYFRLTLRVATSRKDLNHRLEAYFFLWQGDQLRNRLPALENYTRYMTLKDSVRMLEAIQRNNQARFQVEITKREAENEVLKAKTERKNAVIIGMAVVILSAAFTLFLLLRTKKRVVRVNHLLEERNSEVKRVNNQLETRKAALERHMATLTEFGKNRSLAVGNLKHAAKDIVTITAKKLEVSQVSIWIYDPEHQCIQSIACYNLHSDSYSEGAQLSFQDAPAYFEAIRTERIISAPDARTHKQTREFATNYFRKNDIRSLLDVTFFLDGNLKGLLCCEQQKEIRYWTAEDTLFVSSVSDIITLAFRTAQRLEYERQLKDQKRKIEQINGELEQRVKERTSELETQNKRLAEYAFINSHLLRAPLSRILGLINLAERDQSLKEAEMIDLLKKSGDELDQIVRKISEALHDTNYISIDQLKK